MKNNQLSGKVSRTPQGRAINDLSLAPRKKTILANSPTGQIGPWEKNEE